MLRLGNCLDYLGCREDALHMEGLLGKNAGLCSLKLCWYAGVVPL